MMSIGIPLKKIAATLLLLVFALASMQAFAEDENQQRDIDVLIDELKVAGEEHIIWEPEVREVEKTSTILNPQYTLPEKGDLEQEEALSIALDTLFHFTDLTIQDIYNTYNIRFFFNITPSGADRYWTVLFNIGEGKMGRGDYIIEVSSPDGIVYRFEDVTT